MRNRLGWTPALVVGIIVGSTALAAEDADLTISVHVLADDGIPMQVLAPAKAEATRIYRTMGIDLIWADERSGSSADLTIRIIEKPIKRAGASAMGVAPRSDKGAGTLLFAFYSRIEAFARQHDKPIAQILGHVMAHEMGHLLLPYGSHTRSGIMLAAWDRAQVEQIGRGWLLFTAEQGEEIRKKARTLPNFRLANVD